MANRSRPPRGLCSVAKSRNSRRGTVGRSDRELTAVNRLPGTAQEARYDCAGLDKLCPQGATVYSEQYALEGVLKVVQSPRVLVLSTHDLISPTRK